MHDSVAQNMLAVAASRNRDREREHNYYLPAAVVAVAFTQTLSDACIRSLALGNSFDTCHSPEL